MDKSAQRELIKVGEEWSIPQISQALDGALHNSSPALGFGATNRTHVDASIALVLATSGSTGLAKEVALSASALIASATAAHQRLKANPGERWSLLLPVTHIAGINVLIRALELGTDPVDNRDRDDYQDAEYISIVPTQLHRALTGDLKLLKHLRAAKAVLVGGAATALPMIEHAKNQKIQITTTYGMTEMCGGCIYDQTPLAGVDMRVNENGAIQLRGAVMASGYLNQPDLWREAIIDGWFTTGDIGEINAGKLQVLGRNDDQIISGGKKISLGLIEIEVMAIFPNQKFMAFSLPDAEWGERLCLASDQPIETEQIIALIRGKFGGYAVPKEFHQLESLPTKGIDKPDRNRLRALFLAP
jgi:O-succinylbenzoic acid--CoA ligase